MRYEKDHKKQTRRRIVEAAAARFREDGFSAAGLKATLAAAGLTNGAFYNHFHSKDELARDAVAEAMAQRTALLREAIEGGGGVEQVINNYFTPRHRDNPGLGCPSSALAADVARQSGDVRTAYAEGLERFLGLMASSWPGLDTAEGRRRALSIYSLMVGSMQLARAVPDATESERILENGRHTALALIRL